MNFWSCLLVFILIWLCVYFCRAVYCIIGRCDSHEDHGEIVLSTDDYLWMKLMQVICEDIQDDKDELLTLTKLQTMLIEEFGMLSKQHHIDLAVDLVSTSFATCMISTWLVLAYACDLQLDLWVDLALVCKMWTIWNIYKVLFELNWKVQYKY